LRTVKSDKEEKMLGNRRNWAGNYTYSAARYHAPETVEQLQELVSRSSKLRALGSRHSFNGIADTTEDLISMEHFDQVLSLDRQRNTVTVEAGIKYGQLGQYLHSQGYALHNLASLPHISVAGACATATHGSGNSNGNLATAVAAIELITASGDLVVLSRDQSGEAFQGAVVGLGGLGVVTKMTLDIMPTFAMQQEVYENLPVAQLEENFDAIVSSAYSVSLFTDWQKARVNQVWLKRRLVDDVGLALAPGFFEATLAPTHRHPLVSLSAEPCTVQMGIPGPWNERMPHFRVDQTPASGDELQTEYFVPPTITDGAIPLDFRGAHHRRRHTLDEPQLRASLYRHSLFLEKELAGSPEAAPADRSAARTIRRPPALGKAVYNTAGAITIPVREAARFSTAAAIL
jgi:alditol oxidase